MFVINGREGLVSSRGHLDMLNREKKVMSQLPPIKEDLALLIFLSVRYTASQVPNYSNMPTNYTFSISCEYSYVFLDSSNTNQTKTIKIAEEKISKAALL